jgi:hypothetical protein
MNLLSQWWTPSDERRLDEIRECREANESSGLFSDVVYVDAQGSSKTYRELFGECVDRWPGELCVVANTDIIFDDTISLIEPHVDDRTFVALTRWDSPVSPRMIGHVLHVPRTTESQGKQHFDDFCFFSGSQDSWAFLATEAMRDAPDLPLGMQACDQAIVSWAASRSFRVINPCLSVKTWHRHGTFSRPPSGGAVITGMYAYPQATTIAGVDETMLATHLWTSERFGKPIEWGVVRKQECRP